ncbi:MAG: hypothetical protein V4620_10500 [Bacteroidota bacterium]
MSKRELNDDEFDIEYLAYKLLIVLKKGLNWFLYPFKLVFLKPKRLALVIGVLFAVSLVIRFATPAIYKSNFILKPANQGDLNFASILNDIKVLVKNDDYEEAAEILHLSPDVCEKIYKIDFELIKSDKIYKYTDSVNSVVIDIYTSDRNLFDTIQQSIHAYLETSDYYAKSRKLRAENILEMETKLNKDMGDIDSLKKALTSNAVPRNAGGFVYGEPINPMNVYEKAIVIYKELLSLKYQTNYIASFELVKKCIKTKKRYWPRLSILLPASVILGSFFCLFYNLYEVINRRKKQMPDDAIDQP